VGVLLLGINGSRWRYRCDSCGPDLVFPDASAGYLPHLFRTEATSFVQDRLGCGTIGDWDIVCEVFNVGIGYVLRDRD